MRNWILTRVETVMLIAVITLVAGGAVWAAGLGWYGGFDSVGNQTPQRKTRRGQPAGSV